MKKYESSLSKILKKFEIGDLIEVEFHETPTLIAIVKRLHSPKPSEWSPDDVYALEVEWIDKKAVKQINKGLYRIPTTLSLKVYMDCIRPLKLSIKDPAVRILYGR